MINNNEIEELPALLTVKEMAEALKITQSNAYRIIYKKCFQILRIGPKKIRIPRYELIKWMESDEYNTNFCKE